MRHYWIKKDGSRQVIAFFLGWGADEKCLARMKDSPCDVVCFYDYKDLSTDVRLDLYDGVYIVGWSMGVFNAECFMHEHTLNVLHKTAVAGTCRPVDDEYGLLVDICRGTLDNWADTTRRKFSMRMCGGRSAFADLLPLMSERTVNDQHDELAAIMSRADKCNLHDVDVNWHKAIISVADLIFLPDNQRRYWMSHANTVVDIEMPHFPFGVITDWNVLLND